MLKLLVLHTQIKLAGWKFLERDFQATLYGPNYVRISAIGEK